MASNVKPTPIKVIEDEYYEDPKILSQASEAEMKRNQNEDTDQFATAYLRDSLPEPEPPLKKEVSMNAEPQES